jgi:hypothetical protein
MQLKRMAVFVDYGRPRRPNLQKGKTMWVAVYRIVARRGKDYRHERFIGFITLYEGVSREYLILGPSPFTDHEKVLLFGALRRGIFGEVGDFSLERWML